MTMTMTARKSPPLPQAALGHPPGAAEDAVATADTPLRPRKKSWQAPQVRTGHLFESNSLACGKNTPQLEQCTQNPLNS
jgi:hypothetical protein